jgi:hypothetical protein
MPALAQTFMTPATSAEQSDQTMGMNELTEDAKKVAMLTWAMKFHNLVVPFLLHKLQLSCDTCPGSRSCK